MGKGFSYSIISLSFFILMGSCSSIKSWIPSIGKGEKPVLRQREREVIAQGDTRLDLYAWVFDPNHKKEILQYIEEENDYAKKRLGEKSGKTVEIIQSNISEYSSEFEGSLKIEGREHSYSWQSGDLVRLRGDKAKEREVISTIKELEKGKRIFDLSEDEQLSDWGVSPKESYAYFVFGEGEKKEAKIFFKDLKNKKLLPICLKRVGGDIAWAEDEKSLYYLKDQAQKEREKGVFTQAFKVSLETYKGEVIFEEKREGFSLSLRGARTGKEIFLRSTDGKSSEERFVRDDSPVLVQGKLEGVDYRLYDGGDRFYIRTNYFSPNYRLLKVGKNEKNLGVASWRHVQREREGLFLEDLQSFKDFLVLLYRGQGKRKIQIISRMKKLKSFHLDDVGHIAFIKGASYKSSYFFYKTENIYEPREDISYHVFKREKNVIREEIVPLFQSRDYQEKEVKINNQIPISLMSLKKEEKKGKNPILLTAYGAFGKTLSREFNPGFISLMNQGFSLALVHVKGGGWGDDSWRREGVGKDKRSTALELFEAAKYFKEKGHSVYFYGYGEGALLGGVVLNENPKVFSGLVLRQARLDLLNTLLSSSANLNAPETRGKLKSEFGDPYDRGTYFKIKSYDPYENLKTQDMPPVLLLVDPGKKGGEVFEMVKWLGKLRNLNPKNRSTWMVLEDESWESMAHGFLLGVEAGSID